MHNENMIVMIFIVQDVWVFSICLFGYGDTAAEVT